MMPYDYFEALPVVNLKIVESVLSFKLILEIGFLSGVRRMGLFGKGGGGVFGCYKGEAEGIELIIPFCAPIPLFFLLPALNSVGCLTLREVFFSSPYMSLGVSSNWLS